MQTLAALGVKTLEAVAELVETYATSDDEIQRTISKALRDLGLIDPKDILDAHMKGIRDATKTVLVLSWIVFILKHTLADNIECVLCLLHI